MFTDKKDIVVVLGPTASGKSSYAIQLAKKHNAVIISADAYQVYKKMDIGTAKVTKQEQQGIKHYLIDIKHHLDSYSAAEFVKKSNDIISNCRKQNIPVVICGGTALYLHSFLYNYQFPAQHRDQEQIDSLNRNYPENHDLWARLNEVDSEAAKKIHPNNRVRALRAIHVTLSTGKPFSQQATHTKKRSDVNIVGLERPREALYDRINQRVDDMLNKGLEKEVYSLVKSGYNQNIQASRAIGYKEVLACFSGQIKKEEMIRLIKKNTRNFAKRQMTWFKKFENVQWI